jgi:hypothetical protein
MSLDQKAGDIKVDKNVKSSYNRCITCNKACSMSGMCMKPWPEFKNRGKKGAADGGKNGQKNS